MHVGRTMAVVLGAVLLAGVAVGPVRAQTSLDTQKGAPPAPNANAPEYAPPPLAPAERPAIEPAPGKPGLAPAPGATSARGQGDAAAKGRTILGLHPMTAFLVGLGVVGACVLVFGAMTVPARRRRVGRERPSQRGEGHNQG